MVTSKQQSLDELAATIVSSGVCSELSRSALQLVMGSGNPDADIVLIGEAPGKKEDEQGLPFIGASGRFLDEMLAAAGMSRDDVYITNIVKYRPPNNRDPSKEEKAEFWPYLVKQLGIIDPKVVITLGRHSGMAFLPDLVISRDHGQVNEVELEGRSYIVIPLYHPAAALYNGSMRQTLIADFTEVARRAGLSE